MIIFDRAVRKIIPTIFLALFIFIQPSWAWKSDFTNYPVKNLKVVKIDSQRKIVIMKSPDGETANFTVGDRIGQEEFRIFAIYDFVIELEGPPDDSGRKRRDCIPLIPINTLDKSYSIPVKADQNAVNDLSTGP